MENKQNKIVVQEYNYLDLPKIIVLDIPDNYQYMDEELISIIEDNVKNIIINY